MRSANPGPVRTVPLSVGLTVAVVLAAGPGPTHAQPAPRGAHVDTLHGVRVPDPYRWMEAMEAEETRLWVEAQDSRARTFAGEVPSRAALRDRVAELADVRRYRPPWKRGGRYFYLTYRSSGSPAERAGLREGMHVADRENAAPWRGRWDPDQATIVVVDEDGSHRRFEVRAAGATMEIPEFTPTASGGQPTLFAPGVISTEEADDLHPTFTRDGRTLYFVRRVPGGRFTIMVSRLGDDERWSDPRVAPFSGRYSDQEPFLSRDGRRLYFTSDRPVRGNEPVEGRETWVVEWRGSGWSEPRRLEAPIRVPRSMAHADGEPGRFWGQARGPTEGPDGALYFWAERPGSLGHTDIYRAPAGPVSGRFGEPENLDRPVNTEDFETGAVLAPDGCTLFFGRDDPAGFGLGDLFVSRRSENGWSEPENLGASVNSDQFDFAPRVSRDGRRLYFSSNRNREGEGRGSQNIYYVQLPHTRFLDAARRVRSSTDSTRADGGG